MCAVLAGWTTANPTLYRAGLAIQVATPNWSRWKVTLAAGALTYVTACLPAVLASLDRLLAYKGLFLLPLGAFIFADVWLFPRLGLVSGWTEKRGGKVSWPAAIAWAGTLGFALLAYGKDNFDWLAWVNACLPRRVSDLHLDLFYLTLPAWIFAAGAYTVLCVWEQRRAALPAGPARLGT